jgi:uncharacterized RDD family membrane protein YckC
MPARIGATTFLGVFVLPAVVFGLLYFPIVTQLSRGLVSPYAKADVRRRLFAATVDGLLVVTTCLLYRNSGVLLYLAAGAAYLLLRDAIKGQSIGKCLFGLVVISLETGRVSSLAGSIRRNLLLLLPGANIVAIFLEAGTVIRDSQGQRLGDRLAQTQVVEGLGAKDLVKSLQDWLIGLGAESDRASGKRPRSGANPFANLNQVTGYTRAADAPPANHRVHFSNTHVVMQRMFCTFVVLRGSANLPPSADVQLRSVRSSTTKRSEPSGNRMRPTLAGR